MRSPQTDPHLDNDPRRLGKLVASVLTGAWRASPPPPSLSLSPAALTEVTPLLLRRGAGSLGWWRVRSSELGTSAPAHELKVTWSASIVSYVSVTAGTFGSLTLNETDVASGIFIANLFNGTGTSESFRALTLTFSGLSAGATAVEVEVTGSCPNGS